MADGQMWIGKIAIVTGSSAGIGAAIFEEFAKAGLVVIGLARRPERIEALIEKLGNTKGNAFAYTCDVSDPNSVKEAFKWIESKFGVVHILVNNAGIGRNGGILDDNEEAFTKLNDIIDTNVRGLLQCTREAFRLMKKSDDYGLIININSVFGHVIPVVPQLISIYAASKFAVTAISETLRQELVTAGNRKIRITSLSPGRVDTEISTAANLADGTGGLADVTEYEGNEYFEILSPKDIAHSVMFLLSTPFSVNISELTIKPVGEKF